LLSFCTSILAVALAATALLMVHDRTKPAGTAARAGAWERRIDRLDARIERIRDHLGRGGEKDRQSAGEQLDAVRAEIDSWIETAEPRFQGAADRLKTQADDVRTALGERSEQTAEKLQALRESLRTFRKRVVGEPAKSPPTESP
jgi:DNA anti-recombination protein RmuC